VITDAVKKFGVTALPREFNPQALGNVTPRYSWQIDPAKIKITGPEVMQKLADTRPTGIGSLGAGVSGMRGRNPDAPAGDKHAEQHRAPRDPNTFGFAVWQLKVGEERMIADRLVEIFSAVRKA
jgi:L-seryl-tRNA(Ser) seleniumtransferase